MIQRWRTITSMRGIRSNDGLAQRYQWMLESSVHRTVVTLCINVPLDAEDPRSSTSLEELLARWREIPEIDQVTAEYSYGNVFEVSLHLSHNTTPRLRKLYHRLSKEVCKAPFQLRSRSCILNEMFP